MLNILKCSIFYLFLDKSIVWCCGILKKVDKDEMKKQVHIRKKEKVRHVVTEKYYSLYYWGLTNLKKQGNMKWYA